MEMLKKVASSVIPWLAKSLHRSYRIRWNNLQDHNASWNFDSAGSTPGGITEVVLGDNYEIEEIRVYR